jgi:hypothetical protein
MRYFATALLAATAVAYDGCTGESNLSPVLEIEPQLIAQVPNGTAWKMESGSNVVYIAKIAGSPYEMGYAYG